MTFFRGRDLLFGGKKAIIEKIFGGKEVRCCYEQKEEK